MTFNNANKDITLAPLAGSGMSDTLRNARDAILDYIYEYGTAGEGVNALFDKYAALAALPEQRPQAPEPTDEQIAAGWKHAEAYDGDDRQDIKSDVFNAFQSGAVWERKRAVKQGAPAAPALTDEQIDRIADALFSLDANDCTPARCREVIRAALASIPNTEAGMSNTSVHPAEASERRKAP